MGLIFPSSTFLTVVFWASLLFCFVPFLVRMWFLKAFFLLILPLPVILNRFLAPDFDFNLGILFIRLQLLFFSFRRQHHKHPLAFQVWHVFHFAVFFQSLSKLQ